MTTDVTAGMTLERLTEFAESWNTHDPDVVVAYFAEDGVFHAPIGPDHLGDTNVGRAAIREAVAGFFDATHGRFKNLNVRLYGDFGTFDWDFEYVDESGHTRVVAGCDLLTFRGDAILSKSVYLKRLADHPTAP